VKPGGVSEAQPYVSGKRVILANNMRQPQVIGAFSCHWAAVAALVRLHQPDFKSLGGDRRDDLAMETEMRAVLLEATGRSQ